METYGGSTNDARERRRSESQAHRLVQGLPPSGRARSGEMAERGGVETIPPPALRLTRGVAGSGALRPPWRIALRRRLS